MPETQTTAVFDLKRYLRPQRIFSPAVVMLLSLMIAGALLKRFAPAVAAGLMLDPETALPLKPWQLITYPFIFGCPIPFIFELAIVLLTGSFVERQWGAGQLIQLWLVVTLVCGLVWLAVAWLFGLPIVGLSAAAPVYGLIAVFGLLNRGEMILLFLLPMRAEVAAILLIVMGAVLALITAPVLLIWVGGAAVGYGYVKFRWRLRRVAPHRGRGGSENRGRGFIDLE